MEKRNKWKVAGIILFLISIIFLIMGFYKLVFFDSYDNKYVGGDAYNYLINSSMATAYFSGAIFFVILSIGCGNFYCFSNICSNDYFQSIFIKKQRYDLLKNQNDSNVFDDGKIDSESNDDKIVENDFEYNTTIVDGVEVLEKEKKVLLPELF